MSWLFPAGILAGISLVAIVLLHMRHRLPEVITFPQLAFWPRVPSETRESPRWRKPPLTLLFILQLLAALLLVLAFMRPAIPGFGAFGGQRTSAIHHVVVLDGSTSMLATGEDPGSRWDAALESLDDVLGDWQQGDGVTVIVASARPVAKSAADERQLDVLRSWIEGMAIPGGVPDEETVASLIADAGIPDLARRLTLITDGGLDLDAGGAPMERVVVGEPSAGNVGIVSTRTSPRDAGGSLIEATVLHDRAGTETLPWVARAGDQELASGTLTLAPGQRGTISVRVSSEVERVTLELIGSDALTADNRATVNIGGDSLTGIRIVLVSDVPGPTLRALEVLPGATVETYPSTTPGIAAIAASADLVVYEASAPAEGDIPGVPMLLVQPTGLGDAWQISGVSPDPAIAEVAINDPVLRDVVLEGVTFGETPIYTLPDDVALLASGVESDQEVPLVWRGSLEGQPYIAYAFDPATSSIADRVTFPVLVAQTVDYLAGTEGSGMLAPGELVTIPVADEATSVRVRDAAGDETVLVPSHVAGGSRSVSFAVTARPGVWDVVVEEDGGEELERGALIVNAGDIQESRLSADTPIVLTLPGGDGADADTGAVVSDGEVLTDIWPLLVIAAIAVIGIEWWIWLGRSLASRHATGGQAS